MHDDAPGGHGRFGALDIRSVGERDIVLSRRFAARPALVFEALTTPELLLRWMHGPDGWRMVECEFEATVGGRYRYVWHGPGGRSMAAAGVVEQLAPPTRLVTVERFEDDWTGGDVTSVITLSGDVESTLLTATSTHVSRAARDTALASGMERGVEAGYVRLDGLLAERTASDAHTDR
ncbi:SRPBCC domain-containing protein [Leifsonia sp. fls2-241-R2A-40a]|uniref:SRPBCC domain-containing protein n=1 Tax=Leifsonia sp. fls2-241-R2A-40a TaxID=3040290 RepID=UPI002549DD9D|nr:SRPBCC domain-containing protein [Leifsonia sp. fls2-241-R2A-40a]